ncbi:hypothetical protein GCM10007079_44890 [Nocardiopsis terrae]|nr:hypothetical protein GCM10007079_44890 [Nocardiopsis terrae]
MAAAAAAEVENAVARADGEQVEVDGDQWRLPRDGAAGRGVRGLPGQAPFARARTGAGRFSSPVPAPVPATESMVEA